LAADHPAWELETRYIALALANIIYTVSPRRIIIGGSVRKAGHLGEERFFRMVRTRVREVLNGYLGSPALGEGSTGTSFHRSWVTMPESAGRSRLGSGLSEAAVCEEKKRMRVAGINFDHFHMGDLLRMVANHPGGGDRRDLR
jgi:predicted NBD/HSP70 family sugar kinase